MSAILQWEDWPCNSLILLAKTCGLGDVRMGCRFLFLGFFAAIKNPICSMRHCVDIAYLKYFENH